MEYWIGQRESTILWKGWDKMITFTQVDRTYLPQYDRIPMKVQVSAYYRIEKHNRGLGGFTFVETLVEPYVKDFCTGDDESVTKWEKWDLSNWAFFMAFDGARPVGGAAVATRTEGINMLAGRDDLALLWDIRVDETYKHQGVGQSLFDIGGIAITAIPVDKRKSVTIFIFEENERKVIYAPCDCKPFPMDEQMRNSDLLIIGNTFIGDTLKDKRDIGENHPLRKELHSLEDVMSIKHDLSITDFIVTHIEEDWGKSFDDYIVLEEKHPGVRFAYDGMVVEVK